MSIDTRTPSTRPTLVSIDTPPTLLRHSSDTLRHSKPAIQTDETRGSCLSSANCVKLRHSDTSDTADTPDTPTLDTPTRSDTTHASQLSNHPQTPVRHRPDTSDTVDTSVNRHRSDTTPTLLRHYSDTSDTSDTQTHQGSSHVLLHEIPR